MDKQQWVNDTISDLMYQDEFLEYAEAMDIAMRMWVRNGNLGDIEEGTSE